METVKTPVQVTQDLLALVNFHRENLNKQQLSHKGPHDPVKIIKELQDELSLYGDDMGSTVDRSDPYFSSDKPNEEMFRQAVRRLRENAGEIPESLQRIFDKLIL